tara:strand:+ start:3986 stop:4504 length:519 start_codon:yes stop_codon:yes gene_type:complete
LKTLFLLRHCEAYQFEEEKSDHDKQLNGNGKKSAKLLNNWFYKNNVIIDHILVSSAVRTLTTAHILFSNMKSKIHEKKELYLCGYREILKELSLLDNSLNNVIVIGHEPSISETLKFLISYCRPDLKYVTNSLYPTGGLAILNFNIKSWYEIDEKTGVLDAFVTPNYLKKNE